MRAIVCHGPGRPESLRLETVDRPVPAAGAVLVRVQASSVNPVDFFPLSRVAYIARWLSARGRPKAEILGTDFSGTVEAIGKDVTRFKPGDRVFGGCKGAFAEYLAISESGPVVLIPASVSTEEAAALPVAATTALQAVRDHGRVKPGQKVLINGGSGGVGSFAVQIAKVMGAEVTAVCSPANLDRARSLGADRVIDYHREDFTWSAERYDVLIDVAGSHRWSENVRVLKPHGTYVLTGASVNTVFGGNRSMMYILRSRLSSLFADRRFAFFIARLNQADLSYLGELLASGKMTAAIDRHYDLEDLAPAMAYMGQGHARGKIVIRIGSGG